MVGRSCSHWQGGFFDEALDYSLDDDFFWLRFRSVIRRDLNKGG